MHRAQLCVQNNAVCRVVKFTNFFTIGRSARAVLLLSRIVQGERPYVFVSQFPLFSFLEIVMIIEKLIYSPRGTIEAGRNRKLGRRVNEHILRQAVPSSCLRRKPAGRKSRSINRAVLPGIEARRRTIRFNLGQFN